MAERHLQPVRDLRQERGIPRRGSKATVEAWKKIHAAFEEAINDPAVDPAERRYMRELAEVADLSVAACRLAYFCEGVEANGAA